jgi:hypothetical protein
MEILILIIVFYAAMGPENSDVEINDPGNNSEAHVLSKLMSWKF